MKDSCSRWCIRFDLFFITAFGVFLLPFMLPPAAIQGVSAANTAGFNNKVAAVAAALCSLLVFALAGFWSGDVGAEEDSSSVPAKVGRLPLLLVWCVTIVCGLYISAMSYAFALSQTRYADESYFLDQIGKYLDCGRILYEQIEFPYGPLLFYGPVWIKNLFAPFHLSLSTSYYITLVLEHCLGLLLVAYVLNHLEIARRWRIVFFLLAALQTYPFSIGLNYTHFRFLTPIAFLLLAGEQKGYRRAAACMFVGEFLSLAISPEMGFAFGAASTAYGLYYVFVESRVWLLAVVSPATSAAVFLLIMGSGYLRMLKLFAHGIYNLVVEPLPYILVFLFALVWLVPHSLARAFRHRLSQAPQLAALYIFALALLPVAFGRADPAHVYFNGFAIFVLSLVAITNMGSRPQFVWMTLLVFALLYTSAIDVRGALPELQDALLNAQHHHPENTSIRKIAAVVRSVAGKTGPQTSGEMADEDPADMAHLQQIAGTAPIATPVFIPYGLQSALKETKQYVPSFYDFTVAVLDRSAEEKQIREMNESKWALLPQGTGWHYFETPETTAGDLGINLPYRTVRAPYRVGTLFAENLEANWQPVAAIGSYELYRHR